MPILNEAEILPVQESAEPEDPPILEQVAGSTFYDGTRYYWRHNNKFVPIDTSSLRRHAKRLGIRSLKGEDENQSEVDRLICDVQLDNAVDFAGPIAGHGIGKHSRGDGDFLVTRPPSYIEAGLGDAGIMLEFLDGLLGADQARHFLLWLRASIRNLRECAKGGGEYRPAPAIVLAGPRDCGKTFLVTLLAELFGRAQSANLWLSGASDFNADLAGSELLTIDDDVGLSDGKTRSQISAKLKGALFSGDVKIHPKGKQAFSARPFWRVVYALNDEPEAMQVLPKLDDSMEDKISLFRCEKCAIPLADKSRSERFQAFKSALPAFVSHLDSMDVDPEVENSRSGCTCWRHPDLLASLHAMSAEGKLLALIDDALDADLPMEATAREIETAVKEDPANRADAEKLLCYPNRCGIYLARLANSAPDRVEKTKCPKHVQYYRINPVG